jgi:hypothetical protein
MKSVPSLLFLKMPLFFGQIVDCSLTKDFELQKLGFYSELIFFFPSKSIKIKSVKTCFKNDHGHGDYPATI